VAPFGDSGARYIAIAPAQAAEEKADGEEKPVAVEKAEDVAPVAPATPEEMAEQAYAALEKNCAACHGEGKRQNKVAPVDRASHAKLIEENDVVPGKPDESPLYTRMLDKERPMPPERVPQKPSVAEIEAIRLWIEKGAPAPKAAAQ
jgi:mono/diheme cytochrome c family protein